MSKEKREKKEMTTINVRIEKELKNNAEAVLDSLHISLSSAIKIFLRQCVVEQGIPFKLSVKE